MSPLSSHEFLSQVSHRKIGSPTVTTARKIRAKKIHSIMTHPTQLRRRMLFSRKIHPKPTKLARRKKKHPTPDEPENCEDGELQDPKPCPPKNREPPA